MREGGREGGGEVVEGESRDGRGMPDGGLLLGWLIRRYAHMTYVRTCAPPILFNSGLKATSRMI